ncbi:MAG: hypothetical protein NC095_05880 [Muribaculum sp.]|nr:hypothetical protein [Muribaculum sp.]
MKKSLLFCMMCLTAAGMSAQAVPEVLPYLYGQKVSPDGKWIVGENPEGSIVVFDRTDDPSKAGVFEEVYFGNGNTFAADGTCVGSTYSDEGVIYKDGEMIMVESLSTQKFCALNGITLDGSRICGTLSNPTMEKGGVMFVPFYMDLNETGEYGDPVYLPYPDKDFTGHAPQYVSAVWISNDGKTMLGQVVDDSGMFIYPIVYKADASGEWSYTLPTESLWNPNHLELPEDPGDFNLKYVEPTDYMTAEQQQEYDEAYQNWQASGYDPDLYPNYVDFMSEDERAAYEKAAEEYNEAAATYNEKIQVYLETRNQIYEESVPFLQNGFAMNSDGTKFAAASETYVDDPSSWWPVAVYETYVFDIENGTYSKIESKYTDIVPNQVLAGGEIIGSTPASGEITLSYVYLPGSSDYVPLEEYLATTNPGVAEWIDNNLMCYVLTDYDWETGEETYSEALNTGHASVSDDFSVIASGLFAYMLPDEELAENVFITYVFADLQTSGVNGVVASNSDVKVMRGGVLSVSNTVSDLAVYDLSGRKLFNLANAKGNVNTNLKHGVYIVTYKDMEGNNQSKKVTF